MCPVGLDPEGVECAAPIDLGLRLVVAFDLNLVLPVVALAHGRHQDNLGPCGRKQSECEREDQRARLHPLKEPSRRHQASNGPR